jgi:hypothetical protein
MKPKSVFVVTAVLIMTLFTLFSLLRPLQIMYASPQATTTLYDSSLGTTPSQQTFSYQAINPQPPFTVQASQSYSLPVTVLNTASQPEDYAGYTVSQTVMPTLNRATGFRLTFDLRVITESHSSSDRAGFSIILLGDDLFGVEMAFWEDEIWVQEGNSNLFTHAEGAAYDTTAALTNYELAILSDTYQLKANGLLLLNGSLRQYTDWEPLLDPYEQPNQLFLGDDSSSAGAEVWLGNVSIITDENNTPAYTLYLPTISKP